MKKLWLVASSDLNNEQQDCQIVMISESFQTNLDPDYRIQKKTKGILYTQVLLSSVHLLALVEFVAEVYGQGYIHFLAVCRCCFLQDHPKNSDKKNVLFCCLFLTEEAYSHGGLQTRKLGQTPLSVDQSPNLNIEFSTDSTRTDPQTS